MKASRSLPAAGAKTAIGTAKTNSTASHKLDSAKREAEDLRDRMGELQLIFRTIERLSNQAEDDGGIDRETRYLARARLPSSERASKRYRRILTASGLTARNCRSFPKCARWNMPKPKQKGPRRDAATTTESEVIRELMCEALKLNTVFCAIARLNREDKVDETEEDHEITLLAEHGAALSENLSEALDIYAGKVLRREGGSYG